MADSKNPGASWLATMMLIGLSAWGINSCVKSRDDSRQAEVERIASLTPEEKDEEARQLAAAKVQEDFRVGKANAENRFRARSDDAERVSKEHVRKFLKFPNDANFGFWTIPTIRTNKSQDVYYVESTVKAKNAFGATLTHRWATILLFEDTAWHLGSCAIDDQSLFTSKVVMAKIAAKK